MFVWQREPRLSAPGQAADLSWEVVAQVVTRFNQRGLDVLDIAAGRGRNQTYTSEQQGCILQEVQRTPDRKVDQTVMWSLMTLRRVLRQEALPNVAAETIRQVLHEHSYKFQQTRTWCRTGYAAQAQNRPPARQRRTLQRPTPCCIPGCKNN